jgi:hypothetical protein
MRGMNDNSEQQSQRVDGHILFSAGCLFAVIETALPPF